MVYLRECPRCNKTWNNNWKRNELEAGNCLDCKLLWIPDTQSVVWDFDQYGGGNTRRALAWALDRDECLLFIQGVFHPLPIQRVPLTISREDLERYLVLI